MKPIIKVENLSKQYRIGARQAAYSTLRDSITETLRAPFNRLRRNGNHEDNTIWALKNVNFEVMPGEVVGVIGRNGAGKSTLLKILSRITEPTTGQIDLYGRVGSLLEVGTGFHQELTGRENIFLNGAILGMKRSEIERKFDEIVAFAEIENFIDTPVKHYSSGMYMRLAFAVAAYLEPEILVVDEVLAVGDAEFQKKCLGKMGDVANRGRTVLFVSHNMQAVQSLCKSALELFRGEIVSSGNVRSVVTSYLSRMSFCDNKVRWSLNDAPGNEDFKLLSISIRSERESSGATFSSSSPLYVDIEFWTQLRSSSLCIGFDLESEHGVTLARTYQTDLKPESWPVMRAGINWWRCRIPPGLLNAGLYRICPKVGLHNIAWIVNLNAVIKFEITLDHGESPFWNSLDAGSRPGVVAPILDWQNLN